MSGSLDTLTTPWPPSVSSDGTTEKPRTLNTRYIGDATLDIADGIQTTPIAGSWTWHLRSSDAFALISFLRDHRGRSFAWIKPRETSPRAWMATGWAHSVVSVDHEIVQATFEERFVL